MTKEIYLLSLREQMQNLPDEGMAVYAAMNLGFLKEDEVAELLGIIEDPACDHPDDDPSWTKEGKYHKASDANSRLIGKLIELTPDYLSAHAHELLKRRSRIFTKQLLEHLIRNKCQPIEVFLKQALTEASESELRGVLFEFQYGLAKASLSAEQRDALFDLIEPLWQLPQPSYSKKDYSQILAMLNPQRTQQYFAKFIPLDPEHPMLSEIVCQPGFYKSEQGDAELMRLFDYFDSGPGIAKPDRVDRLTSIVAVMVAKHKREFLPMLQKCAQGTDVGLRRMALRGLVLLCLPHDPVRKALELVRAKRAPKLAAPVRVVGFAALYKSAFNTYELSDFPLQVSATEYGECVEALRQLGLAEHVSLLADLRDELGDDPRKALRKMSESKVDRLYKRYGKRAEKLDTEDVSEAIHAYVLQHEPEFMNLEC